MFDSPLSQTHAFAEKAYFKELQQDQEIFSIDIMKCLRTLYLMANVIIVFLKCLMFDKVDDLEGITNQPDLNYVKTDNCVPMRCNGW